MKFVVALIYIFIFPKVRLKCVRIFSGCSLVISVILPGCYCVDKKPDVNSETKQRTVVEFLTGEQVSPQEIHRRLLRFYGNETVDLETIERWINKPSVSEVTLNGQLLQRIVIQFLASEGAVSSGIGRRLRKVYRSYIYSQCNICRWMRRYKEGDSYVRDRVRPGRPPQHRM